MRRLLRGPVVGSSIVLAAVLALASAASATCDAPAALARAQAAYGKGHARTLELSSALALVRGARVEHKELVERYAFPERVHFEYRGAVSTLVTGDDGARAWRLTPDGPVPANPRHFRVPRRLRNLGPFLASIPSSAVECASGAIDGATRVLVTRDDGEMILLDIDTAGRVVRYSGESPDTAPTDVMEVLADDWRVVDGHLVAFHLTTRVNGATRAETKTSTARVDAELPPRLFVPPAEVGPPPRDL